MVRLSKFVFKKLTKPEIIGWLTLGIFFLFVVNGCDLAQDSNSVHQTTSLATTTSPKATAKCVIGFDQGFEPSQLKGWCKIKENYINDTILVPDIWAAELKGANIAKVVINQNQPSALKPYIEIINTGSELPLENVDEAGYYEMGSDEFYRYVQEDEDLLFKQVEKVRDNQILHLVTQTDDQVIDRYFLKAKENEAGTLYIFEIYIDKSDYIDRSYPAESTIREMVGLVRFVDQ